MRGKKGSHMSERREVGVWTQTSAPVCSLNRNPVNLLALSLPTQLVSRIVKSPMKELTTGDFKRSLAGDYHKAIVLNARR
jgi:hypothetical protein